MMPHNTVASWVLGRVGVLIQACTLPLATISSLRDHPAQTPHRERAGDIPKVTQQARGGRRSELHIPHTETYVSSGCQFESFAALKVR